MVANSLGITRARLVAGVVQESAIDLILSNCDFKYEKEFNEHSDHAVIKMTKTNYEKVNRDKRVVSFYNWNFNELEANEYLETLINSLPIMSEMSCEELDYQIRAAIIQVFNKYVRKSSITVKGSQDIITPKINKLKNWRNGLRKNWSKDRSAINWVNLVRASRILRKEVRETKRAFIKSKLKKNSKDFWKEINYLMGKEGKNVCKLVVEGNEIKDEKGMADQFVKFFTTKVNGILGDYRPSDCVIPIEGVESISELTLKTSLSRLTNKKSAGMDNIPGCLLKILAPSLINPLTVLFNKILYNSAVPSTWKIARLTPVHKKGLLTEVSNYRPVSNLCSIAKVFELCILQKLECLDPDELFGRFQHGFRKKHSTASASAEIVEYLAGEREQKRLVSIYSADLTAAFDVLRKEILVEIMNAKGIPSYLISVIHDYLSDRYGFVQVGNGRSRVRTIRAGCIQGSVIGPILFSIYTSFLSEILSPHKVVAYADDAYLIISADNMNDLLSITSETMKTHFGWLKSIGMVCNPDKTEWMIMDQTVNLRINTMEGK